MIIVTGAAGFIGSNMVAKLNQEQFRDIVLVDDFSNATKNKNLLGKSYSEKIHRNDIFSWLDDNQQFVQFVVHLGARTDTTEFDKSIFEKLNFGFSRKVWAACTRYSIPLIYASSAATYGMGEFGYSDDHAIVSSLKPLNPYGESKNDFDKWVLEQKESPFFWAGLKFFNVYGPNEFHKGRMASVIFHAYRQIRESGKMNLFRSHRPDYEDGRQLRDFIYVKDVVDVIFYLMNQRKHSGIFNLGTGKARTFHDLALATFHAMKKPVNIEFIDTPADIRDKYQYFTEADMTKLKNVGYIKSFRSLEEGVGEYVGRYLCNSSYL
jgi:ADP-L-glycero-D-manno-heptose 6-epimerase